MEITQIIEDSIIKAMLEDNYIKSEYGKLGISVLQNILNKNQKKIFNPIPEKRSTKVNTQRKEIIQSITEHPEKYISSNGTSLIRLLKDKFNLNGYNLSNTKNLLMIKLRKDERITTYKGGYQNKEVLVKFKPISEKINNKEIPQSDYVEIASDGTALPKKFNYSP